MTPLFRLILSSHSEHYLRDILDNEFNLFKDINFRFKLTQWQA